ncbi:uncharacterized protein LOC129571740 [Sitodiplosis mosellana]|uniref:uncharacterized protein LOC129571740 n=1 Tax=Sitodiplosis mosellana TaxID=263140 RepID=UPI0024449AC8|nr:uncharacterized protein LOC129571740 [Sitodiplosis mosellana]
MDLIKKEMEGLSLTPKVGTIKCELDGELSELTDLKTDSKEMNIGDEFLLAHRNMIECISEMLNFYVQRRLINIGSVDLYRLIFYYRGWKQMSLDYLTNFGVNVNLGNGPFTFILERRSAHAIRGIVNRNLPQISEFSHLMSMHSDATDMMKWQILTFCSRLERELLDCCRILNGRQSIRLDHALNQTLPRINDVLEQTIQHNMPNGYRVLFR